MLLKENMCTESQLLYKRYFSLNGVLFYFLMQGSPFVFAAEHSSDLFAQLTARVPCTCKPLECQQGALMLRKSSPTGLTESYVWLDRI